MCSAAAGQIRTAGWMLHNIYLQKGADERYAPYVIHSDNLSACYGQGAMWWHVLITIG